MPAFTKTQLFAGSVFCAFLVYGGYLVAHRMHNQHELDVAATTANIPDVAVVKPKPAPDTLSITLPGNINAWYQAPMIAQVSGYVKMWYKDYGSTVKAGDILAEINAPSLDAQYAQAKADLQVQMAKYKLAEVTATRWRNMGKSQAVSGQSVTVQNANERAAQSALAAAQSNVDHFAALEKFKTIVAPFDGVVTARNVNVGDYVGAGSGIGDNGGASELFTVADTHEMRLFVSVPEVFSYMLKPGLTAQVTVPQYPNQVFTAKFLTIAKGYDPNTRTAVTEFTIDNNDQKLWPGSFATVALTAPSEPGVYTIPTGALVFQENGMQVAIVDAQDIAHFRNIKVGRMSDSYTEVDGGLQPGDQVIDNPPADLLEGQKVHLSVPEKGYLTTGGNAKAEASAGDDDE